MTKKTMGITKTRTGTTDSGSNDETCQKYRGRMKHPSPIFPFFDYASTFTANVRGFSPSAETVTLISPGSYPARTTANAFP